MHKAWYVLNESLYTPEGVADLEKMVDALEKTKGVIDESSFEAALNILLYMPKEAATILQAFKDEEEDGMLINKEALQIALTYNGVLGNMKDIFYVYGESRPIAEERYSRLLKMASSFKSKGYSESQLSRALYYCAMIRLDASEEEMGYLLKKLSCTSENTTTD